MSNATTHRRVPALPGGRDLITAMDFVVAAMANPKQQNPDFVKWRDEVAHVITECEDAIALAGKADAIPKLHEAAQKALDDSGEAVREAKEMVETLLREATEEAERLRSDAKADAKKTHDGAASRLADKEAKLEAGLDNITSRQSALKAGESQVKKDRAELTDLDKDLKARESRIDGREQRAQAKMNEADRIIAKMKAAMS